MQPRQPVCANWGEHRERNERKVNSKAEAWKNATPQEKAVGWIKWFVLWVIGMIVVGGLINACSAVMF